MLRASTFWHLKNGSGGTGWAIHKIRMNLNQKLRLSLMTRGLNAGVGAGRGKPSRGRGSRPLSSTLSRIAKRPKKTIKCDMCKKEFPANVEESILIHHVKTVHMNKPAQQEKKKSVPEPEGNR